MEVFKDYARYYDLMYAQKEYQQEVDYVLNLITENSTIEVNSLLDLGCGTGRHCKLITKNGISVTGVDLSPEMIDIARSDIQGDEVFYCSDILDFSIDEHFDSVVSLFHVASYQQTFTDFERYLNTAYHHLSSGGVFVFDFWYGPAVLTDPPTVRVKRLNGEGLEVTRIAEPLIHENENLVDVNYQIFISDKTSGRTHSLSETHKMRYWFFPELKEIIKASGFSLNTAYRWMTRDPLSFESWNGVIVLKKK